MVTSCSLAFFALGYLSVCHFFRQTRRINSLSFHFAFSAKCILRFSALVLAFCPPFILGALSDHFASINCASSPVCLMRSCGLSSLCCLLFQCLVTCEINLTNEFRSKQICVILQNETFQISTVLFSLVIHRLIVVCALLLLYTHPSLISSEKMLKFSVYCDRCLSPVTFFFIRAIQPIFVDNHPIL